MSYGVRETPNAIEIDIAIDAAGREGVFRDALTAAVALAFPNAGGSRFEASVPLQAAGETDSELLKGLLEELFRAAAATKGQMGAPRWLLFEPGRVTATLPLAYGGTPARALSVLTARVEEGSRKSSVVLTNGH